MKRPSRRWEKRQERKRQERRDRLSLLGVTKTSVTTRSPALVTELQRALDKLDTKLALFARHVKEPALIQQDRKHIRACTLRSFGATEEQARELFYSTSRFSGTDATNAAAPRSFMDRLRNIIAWVGSFPARPRSKRTRDQHRALRAFEGVKRVAGTLDRQVRARQTMNRLGRTEFFADSRLPSW